MKCDSLILGRVIPFDYDLRSAEAVASYKGKIVYVGSKETAKKLCDSNTKVYDYGNNYVYPGFFDSHCHGNMAGQRALFECDIHNGTCMKDYVDIIAKYVKEHPDRNYYLGSGWVRHEDPNASMLDVIDTDKPIILTSMDGHSRWVNTKAMEVAGLTKEKCKELGYDIARVDDNGNPTGWVSEKATLVFSTKFQPTKKEIKEGLLDWQKTAFKNGMTAVVEAQADQFPDSLEAYKELCEEGKWKLRTYAYPVHYELYPKGGKAVAEKVKEDMEKYNYEYFKVIGTKMFMDGVVEAHTAYLLEPYEDDPSTYGVDNFKDKDNLLHDIVYESNNLGIPVHVHAIGDGAVRKILDVIEKVRIETLRFDVRNNVVHLQLVSPQDIKRFGDLNVGAIVAPLWVPNQPDYFYGEVSSIGVDRTYNAYPIKSLVDNNAVIGFHTDYPITPIVDKPLEIYEAMRRRDREKGVKSVKNPDEVIDAERTLVAECLDAAWLVGQDKYLGKLSIGRIANAVVYDKNFMDCDVETIPDAKLIATLIDGQEVYKG